MSRLRMQISMSLDGYVAGPNQSVDNPLGERGEELHEWVTELGEWRARHGREGGVDNESSEVLKRATEGIAATVMGRNMFGGHPGPWDADQPWTGWWGDDPPFHHPVFVVTHHERDPLEMEGGTTFHFVTDGIESALDQAREAAGDEDVALAGGAQIAQQYLAAGLLDELVLHVVPIFLGDGERLFDNVGEADLSLEAAGVVQTPQVTHIRYSVAP